MAVAGTVTRAVALLALLALARGFYDVQSSSEEGPQEETTFDVAGASLYARDVVPAEDRFGVLTLLLHGNNYRTRQWRSWGVLQFLRDQGVHAVSVDLPGYGRSNDELRGSFGTAADRAEFLEELLATANPEGKPVVLASPSVSGIYAIPYINKFGEKLGGWAAVAPSGVDGLAVNGTELEVLAMYGGNDLPRLPDIKTIEDAFPASTRAVIVPGAPHAVVREATEQFAFELLDLIKKVSLKNGAGTWCPRTQANPPVNRTDCTFVCPVNSCHKPSRRCLNELSDCECAIGWTMDYEWTGSEWAGECVPAPRPTNPVFLAAPHLEAAISQEAILPVEAGDNETLAEAAKALIPGQIMLPEDPSCIRSQPGPNVSEECSFTCPEFSCMKNSRSCLNALDDCKCADSLEMDYEAGKCVPKGTIAQKTFDNLLEGEGPRCQRVQRNVPTGRTCDFICPVGSCLKGSRKCLNALNDCRCTENGYTMDYEAAECVTMEVFKARAAEREAAAEAAKIAEEAAKALQAAKEAAAANCMRTQEVVPVGKVCDFVCPDNSCFKTDRRCLNELSDCICMPGFYMNLDMQMCMPNDSIDIPAVGLDSSLRLMPEEHPANGTVVEQPTK